MESTTSSARLRIGAWQAEHATGELTGPRGCERLEPKVMDLLFLLAQRPGEVFSREEILRTLWRGLVVGDDTLARTVSKLRRALGDDARTPQYIETHSKRGYRLIAPVEVLGPVLADEIPGGVEPAPVHVGGPGTSSDEPAVRRSWRIFVPGTMLLALMLAVVLWQWRGESSSPTEGTPGAGGDADLVSRADDFYFQYTRTDNEAAIELYQRVLALHPDDVGALAGLANALVQQQLRWPQGARPGAREFTRLGDALAAGHLATPAARRQLERAEQLAARAVQLAPASAAAHKAQGFVQSAQGRFEPALAAYREALRLDPDAWGPLINIGDLLDLQGRADEALPQFEAAYAAMARVYPQETARVRRWQAELGVLIGDRYRARDERRAAEAWYRRVLAYAPLHPGATRGLAATLQADGDATAAQRLCSELQARLGPQVDCMADGEPR